MPGPPTPRRRGELGRGLVGCGLFALVVIYRAVPEGIEIRLADDLVFPGPHRLPLAFTVRRSDCP